MIVFELICPKHHRFEGWFSSADDFEGQKRRGLLSCPVCAQTGIEKLPTARIGKAESRPDQRSVAAEPPVRPEGLPAPSARAGLSAMEIGELIDYVLANTENVGAGFAAEARRIHYEEVPYRSIRGTASRAETEELLEEGIQVAALPVPPSGDWH